MRLFIFLSLFMGLLFSNPYEDVVNYKLENGLNVYLLPNKNAKNVYIEAVVNVGMRAESKENAGISHLVEHLIFRDQRVKHKDYLDLINEEGASYVNGYTSDYKTRYVTKIDSKKAYWITQTFYKMLFDKNITNEDLEVERKALQLEIGEPKWTDKLSLGFFEKLGDLIDELSPKGLVYDLHEDDFGIDTKKDKWQRYDDEIYKKNNKKFTLQELLKHYNDYYYPSNMTLKIVGNFDAQKMKEVIDNSFAKAKKRDGKKLVRPIYKDAKLSGEPFVQNLTTGIIPGSEIAMGYKFIDDDIAKKTIIDAYFSYLAERLNRELRNKKGESYSVYGSAYSYYNAGLGSVSFETSHDNFEKNIKLAKKWIKKEASGDISDDIIKKSIQNKKKHYDSLSGDVDRLMGVVSNIIGKKEFYQDGYKNPYSVISSISVDDFRNTIKNEFKDSNFYFTKAKDYFLFPFEMAVLMLITLFIFIYIAVKMGKKRINKKDIRLKVSIGNVLVFIISLYILFIVSGIISDWVKYFILKSFYPELIKMQYFGTELDYLYFVLDFILFIAIFVTVARILFGWLYTKAIVANNKLYLVGYRYKEIDLNDIKNIDISPWSINMFKDIYGFFLRFWKKLVKITTSDGKVYYIRYKKAEELKETLLQLKGKSDV